MERMALATTFVADPAGFSNASLLGLALGDRVARRGWTFRVAGSSVTAHRPEWPTQLCVLVREAEEDTAAMLGVAIDFASMPLRGERFRDVFNNEREALLRGYGPFTLLQQTSAGTWLRAVSGQAFLHGMTAGVSRKAQLAIFDRVAAAAGSLADLFAEDSNRLVETGSHLASELQRLYQRTVLSRPAADSGLPDVVRPSTAMLPPTTDADTDSYPWRR